MNSGDPKRASRTFSESFYIRRYISFHLTTKGVERILLNQRKKLGEYMKKWTFIFFVSLMSLFIIMGTSLSAERFYDSHGKYQGRMDDSGRIYDSNGRYQGKVDQNGKAYDSHGRYTGKMQNGRVYDNHGRYQGKITENGRAYDSHGKYKGQIKDNGSVYDSSGRYVGKVKP